MALVQDWRAHSGGEPLIPVVPKVRRWFIHAVLRRGPVTHTVTAGRSTHWHVAASPTICESPPTNAPVDVQMRFVRERIRALEETIASQRSELDRRIDEMRAAGQKADAEARTAVADLAAKVRDVATGSVRMELIGLLLVGTGSVVATLPAVFGR